MSRFTIDQRTPLEATLPERLPQSACKPVRKRNHAAYQSPAYGETKTSPMRESGDYISARSELNRNDALEWSKMRPDAQRRWLKRHGSELQAPSVAVRAVVQPRVFTLDRAGGNRQTKR